MGTEAAELRWTLVQRRLKSWLCGVVGTFGAVAGAYSHGALRMACFWVFVVGYSLAGLGLITTFYAFHKWSRALSQWETDHGIVKRSRRKK